MYILTKKNELLTIQDLQVEPIFADYRIVNTKQIHVDYARPNISIEVFRHHKRDVVEEVFRRVLESIESGKNLIRISDILKNMEEENNAVINQ